MKPKYFIITGLLFVLIAAWCSDGYLHPDEHFQLLEFAQYKMGGIPAEHLPWEFDQQMRPAFQVVIVYGLCTAMKSLSLFDPYVASMLLRLVTGLFMFYVVYKLYLRFKNEITDPKGVLWLAILSFTLWYFPFVAVRYSSESFGTIFMLAAMLLFFKSNKSTLKTSTYLLIGICLGISFISRFQMAFMIVGFGLWLLFIQKTSFRFLMVLAAGFILAFGLGMVCDYWFYGKWVISPYNYFYQNLVENKAAGFGVSPVWYYASLTPLVVFPILGIVIVPAFIIFIFKYPKHVFTWCMIPFILIHHAIGHKELRFLFALVPFIPFVIVMAFQGFKWIRYLKFTKYIFWIINVPALFIMSIKPAYDNMEMFKYLYRHQATSEIYYIWNTMPFMMYQYELTHKPFIKGQDLKMTFFHRPGFNPHPVNDIQQLISIVENSNSPVIFSVRTPHYKQWYKTQFEQAGIEQRVLYSTYHTWLYPINYNDWLSRDDVGAWTVVQLSR